MAKKITAPSKKVDLDSSKGKPWAFPKNTLEDAITILKAIDEKNAGNPMHATDLCSAVGFASLDWRFTDLLKSANLYGLVNGSGSKALVHVEPIGQEIISPSSSQERRKALLEAFKNVEDFKKVEEFYGNKRIPEDEFFYNTLIRTFNIPRDRVDKFAEVFMKNINFLKAFNVNLSKEVNESEPLVADEMINNPINQNTATRVRQFLDTCFVMMPFDEWHNRYYKDIYIHAIKDAGFEPIRADELFHTGSVVEQIWEQISKSKILLAELTGKNANVFYELGLAHAAV